MPLHAAYAWLFSGFVLLTSKLPTCIVVLVICSDLLLILLYIMYMYVNVAVESIRALGSIPRVPPRRSLPPWEVKILAAQNIIFNQELFSQVHVFVTLSALHNA